MDRPLDWTLLQAFAAVAEHGSLSAGAVALGLSQPTLGRQVRALEQQVGADLFHRHARGLSLSQAGHDLWPAVETMREAAAQARMIVAGNDQVAEGTVRITASEVVSHRLLPQVLAGIARDLPQIELELVPSDRVENLLYREADIAVRMIRPTQLDVLTQHLGDLRLGLFAASDYIARRGMPGQPRDLLDHDLVGLDRSEVLVDGFRTRGLPVSRSDFRLRCDHQAVNWELVRAGCGIGLGMRVVALSDPGVQQVLPGLPVPDLPIWLTCHERLRNVPRIAAVRDRLERAFRDLIARDRALP